MNSSAKPEVTHITKLNDLWTHFMLMGNYLFVCSEFLLVLSDSIEYTLTKEDVGRHLKFVYTPVNLEGLLNWQALAVTCLLLVGTKVIFH
jgi:hypothetical protein